MSTYNQLYQQDHNIEWYAKFEGRCLHFCSCGSLIPDEINDKERNRAIQQYVAQHTPEYGIDLQNVFANNAYLIDMNNISLYQYGVEDVRPLLDDAFEASFLGFYSYCFWGIDKWGGRLYRLVSCPLNNNHKQLEELDIPNLTHAQYVFSSLHVLHGDSIVNEFIRVW